MLAPIPQQDAGHLDQPQVVRRGLLIVAHQDGPALREPAQSSLHYPSPRRIAFLARIIFLLLADTPDVRDVAVTLEHFPSRLLVVTLVQAQVLRRLLGGFGRSVTMASSVASKSLKSGTLASAITTERGPPVASTRIERLTPTLALSVGLGPTRYPQNVPCPSLHPPPATQSPRHPTPGTPRSGLPISHPALPSRSTSGRYDARKSRRGTRWAVGSTGNRCSSGR